MFKSTPIIEAHAALELFQPGTCAFYSLSLIEPPVETGDYKYLPGMACQTGNTPPECIITANHKKKAIHLEHCSTVH
jgi:hypothetical protein